MSLVNSGRSTQLSTVRSALRSQHKELGAECVAERSAVGEGVRCEDPVVWRADHGEGACTGLDAGSNRSLSEEIEQVGKVDVVGGCGNDHDARERPPRRCRASR